MKLSLEQALHIVAKHTNATADAILSSSSKHTTAHPRHIFCHIAYKYCNASLQTIADYLGKSNHTSVLHSRKYVKAMRETNVEFDEFITYLEQLIDGNKEVTPVTEKPKVVVMERPPAVYSNQRQSSYL